MEGLKEIQKLEGHTDRVWSLAWNPLSGLDGAPLKLASCSGDKTVRIWEHKPSNSWECQAVLDDPHTRTVRSCAWSPSGKLLATASFDGTTAIFQDVGDDYECVSTLEGHENEVKSVSWNASGSLLATCGRDKTVWIWEVSAAYPPPPIAAAATHPTRLRRSQHRSAHQTSDDQICCTSPGPILLRRPRLRDYKPEEEQSIEPETRRERKKKRKKKDELI
ncbi:hypothetical protein ABKV19_013413 [Rosa sericea]